MTTHTPGEVAAGIRYYALASEEAFNRSGFHWPTWKEIDPRARAAWIADAMGIIQAFADATEPKGTDELWRSSCGCILRPDPDARIYCTMCGLSVEIEPMPPAPKVTP